MKDLSTFVKDEFKKNRLFEDSVYIDTIDKADNLVAEVGYGRYVNIVFRSSSIKDYFIDKLSTMRPDINVINCNCSIDRFYENDLNTGLLVFNNVKRCKHNELIEEIKKYKGILIC